MQKIHRSALLPYPVEFVCSLVSDISRYPEFIPWCESAVILSRSVNEVVAQLSFRTRGIHESLTTRNTLNPPWEIRLELVEGPFREFAGHWSFQPIGENAGCRVSLDLEFSLKRGVGFLEKALSGSVGRAADAVLKAFADRAKQCSEKVP